MKRCFSWRWSEPSPRFPLLFGGGLIEASVVSSSLRYADWVFPCFSAGASLKPDGMCPRRKSLISFPLLFGGGLIEARDCH